MDFLQNFRASDETTGQPMNLKSLRVSRLRSCLSVHHCMVFCRYQRNSTANAMIKQLTDTYGLNRVPMTEPLYSNFLKRPFAGSRVIICGRMLRT